MASKGTYFVSLSLPDPSNSFKRQLTQGLLIAPTPFIVKEVISAVKTDDVRSDVQERSVVCWKVCGYGRHGFLTFSKMPGRVL